MIKGVNKQVLEINETQNSFFEKAIFFVKPEYSGLSEGRLKEKATKEMNNICHLPELTKAGTRNHTSLFCKALYFVAGLVAGILFCSLI